MDEPSGTIKDPKALRALAHPLRWRLIDLLAIESTATATRCAEVLGESVASCSYHLNTLAKYGYVAEADGGQGRERPWRMASHDQSWRSDGEDIDVDSALAGQALTEVFLDHEATRMKEWSRRRDREPRQWRDATTINAVTTFLTLDELTELTAELHRAAVRFGERLADPATRPEGTRPVRIFLSTSLPSTEG